MSLKEQLIETAKTFLEGIESSKEIIADNSTSFDEMGMATNEPGEFAPEEITDQENLVNVAKMSNDNDFAPDSGETEISMVSITAEPMCAEKELEDLVNLGDDDSCEDEEHCEHHKHHHHPEYHHMADVIESILKEKGNKLFESDYAGNLSYNPDKRLNASDILNAVKNAVKPELAAALSVVKNVDGNEEPSYAIQNIDAKDLPETIEIDTNTDEKVILKKDGNSYKFDK